MVERLSEVFGKITGPGAAKAARRIETGVKAQRLAGPNGQKRLTCLERFQFVVILNARQFKAINFRVLQDQRFVRRPEHRAPVYKAKKMKTSFVMQRPGRGGHAHQRAAQAGQQGKQEEFTLYFSLHEVAHFFPVRHYTQLAVILPFGCDLSNEISQPPPLPKTGTKSWLLLVTQPVVEVHAIIIPDGMSHFVRCFTGGSSATPATTWRGLDTEQAGRVVAK